MKRIILVLASIVFIIGLNACGKNEDNAQQDNNVKTEENKAAKQEENGGIGVDENLLSVDITLPASFLELEEMDVDDVIEKAEKEEGIKEVVQNEDGSITYTISKAKHKELMKDLARDINEEIKEIKTDDDFVSIQDIEANDSFSKFTMKVNREKFENSLDGFAALGLALQGMLYQVFDGGDKDDIQVTIDITDADTGELIDTVIYPDDLEKSNTES